MPLSRNVVISFALIAVSPGVSGQSTGHQKPTNAEIFVNFGDEFFKSIKAKPSKETVRKIKNRYDESQVDLWITREYPHFKVVLVHSETAPEDLLNSLTIFHPRVRLPLGIKVGDTPDQVLKVLGKPTKRKSNVLEYETGELLSESATFRFTKGTLSQVEWYFEID